MKDPGILTYGFPGLIADALVLCSSDFSDVIAVNIFGGCLSFGFVWFVKLFSSTGPLLSNKSHCSSDDEWSDVDDLKGAEKA